MTKKQQQILDAFNKSELSTLFDCYERPSQDKHDIYMKCRERYYEQNGKNFTIISYNTFMFTCGWQFQKDGEWYFHYETHKSIKEWKI